MLGPDYQIPKQFYKQCLKAKSYSQRDMHRQRERERERERERKRNRNILGVSQKRLPKLLQHIPQNKKATQTSRDSISR